MTGSEPLSALRKMLSREGFRGLILPRADSFLGHDIQAREERLAWATGFTGSAGYALILDDAALLCTDSRYTEQARVQVLPEIDILDTSDPEAIETWAAAHLRRADRLAYLPALHSVADVEPWQRRVAFCHAELVALGADPFDALWPERPAPRVAPVQPYGLEYAGRSSEDKRAEIAGILAAGNLDAALISARESNAWLFNLRGSDLSTTPVADAMSVLRSDGSAVLFLHEGAADSEVPAHLGSEVQLGDLGALAHALPTILAPNARISIDPDTTNSEIFGRAAAAGADIVRWSDPCLLPKARKTATEIEHARQVHIVDGAALTRFLHWMEQVRAGSSITEIDAENALRGFREMSPAFTGPSFPTISAAGPNAAITHYQATPATARRIGDDPIYLCDSGGQYPGATTDVTRTVAVGVPTAAMRAQFTAVARGHIALAMAEFPVGTTGGELDILARQHLWRLGLDYRHSTGHGVGSYLNVHEGPQKIRRGDTVPLEPGMIVSNEPGYYEIGSHGMRLENLMVVCPSPVPDMLAFETLTQAPIDRRLIDLTALAADEIAWLDRYHAGVVQKIRPFLDKDQAEWLDAATRPIGVFEA